MISGSVTAGLKGQPQKRS